MLYKGWSLPYAQCIRPRPGSQSGHGDTSSFSRSHGVTGHFWERSRGHRIFLGAVCIILISDSCHSIQYSLAMHTYSHASEEHVRLIMRVEHRSDGSDRLAHGKEYALHGALSARPAPLPITYSCMGRGKEQFSLRACFTAHAVSTRPSFYPIARVGPLLDQVRG